MSVLEWKDPPARTKVNPELDAILEALKARPGEWALVGQGTQNSISQALRVRGCEATTRRNGSEEPKTYDVYARWPAE